MALPFFKSKPNSFLGVDLGAGGIKVVEMGKNGGRARLLTYGYTERSPELAGENILDSEKTGVILAKVCQKAKVKGTRVVAGLPISLIFNSVFSVLPASEKELKASIELQARKLLPYPIEDAVLDWKILEEKKPEDDKKKEEVKEEVKKEEVKKQSGNPAKLQKVLLTAAPKDLINKYVEIFKKAKLELASLETEAFALVRSLVGKDKSVVAIVDIGTIKTNVLIVDNGMPIVSKSIDTGGLAITKILSEKMKVGLVEAEEFKKDTRSAQRVIPNGSEMPTIPKPIEMLLTPVINEIRYSFNLYFKENENEGMKKVEKIILTGGTALYPQLAKYFSETLNLKVFVGNPWARVLFPDELKPDLDELGSRFAVPIGLAMREIE